MSTSDGRVIGVTKIVDHGPDTERWAVALLGDGYQESELPIYAVDAQAFVDYLHKTVPFDQLWEGINVYRVDVSSTESGAGDPVACGGSGAIPKTYFDATFCHLGVPRLLGINTATALSVSAEKVPHAALTIVLVNSVKYGGSGGSVAVCSKAPLAFEIAIHESGHVAFGLADEYSTNSGTYPQGNEPICPNVTSNKDRATIKWASLIGKETEVPTTSNANCSKPDFRPSPVPPATVGAFEGALYHCGAWRPQYDCRMRTLGKPFCAVCTQEIIKTISPHLPITRT